MIGSVIDKYEVLQRLGEGATATVYRGRHLAIGRDVAIKVLHPHLSATSRYRERFHREARAFGRLSHPNIVGILDYSGAQADDCYIVTELVDGLTLLDLLQQHGRMPSEICASIAVDLASALAVAHAAGIIHRDLKPENVMVRRDGRVKLMDFGVARVLDEGSITVDGSLLGSPAYMSPQQALDGPIDARTDLFSLGTLCFHAVTGHVPFSGGNTSVILRNIIDGNRPDVLELAPDASPALVAVIDRLLAAQPDDRYPDAEAARVALLGVFEEVGLAVDHPAINLRGWLVEPEACRAALDAHLRTHLVAAGRARLAAGDTLGALRLFNRMLALDEDNADVLALIHSLHEAPTAEARARRRWLPYAAAGAVALGGAGLWAAWPANDSVMTTPAPATALPVPASPPSGPVTSDTGGSALAAAADPPNATRAPSAGAPAPRPPVTARPSVSAAPVAPQTMRREAPASAPRAAQGRLVLQLTTPVEVSIDGVPVGTFRMGPSAAWIGTRAAPIVVDAGERVVSLRNAAVVEPYEERIYVEAGAEKVLAPALKRRPVTFQIDATLPRACEVRVGSAEYRSIPDFGASFSIRDPDPSARITFRCPAPLGEFSEPVGPTFGGEFIVLPRKLP